MEPQLKQTENHGFWTAVETSWDKGISVVGKENDVKSDVHILCTFCPLYALGSLEDSRLLDNASIDTSRVASKWNALRAVLKGLNSHARSAGGSIEVTAVFANRGVLLGTDAQARDFDTLEIHGFVYEQALKTFSVDTGIECRFATFDDLDVPLPKFVNTHAAIPDRFTANSNCEGLKKQKEALLIEALNNYAQIIGLADRVSIVNNKHNRKRVTKIMNMWRGPSGELETGATELAFWLLAGYITFDHLIPDILHSSPDKTGIYLVTERFDPLFAIAEFTASLKPIPRVNIKA